jgi:hypothetical protein
MYGNKAMKKRGRLPLVRGQLDTPLLGIFGLYQVDEAVAQVYLLPFQRQL